MEAGMYFAVSSVVRFAAAGMHLVLSVPGLCHLTSPKPVRVQNGKPVGPKISFKLEIEFFFLNIHKLFSETFVNNTLNMRLIAGAWFWWW